MQSRKIWIKASVMIALVVMAFRPEQLRADEDPFGEDCSNSTYVSSSSVNHCCNASQCGNKDVYALATHHHYTNPGCHNTTHDGTNGCCS